MLLKLNPLSSNGLSVVEASTVVNQTSSTTGSAAAGSGGATGFAYANYENTGTYVYVGYENTTTSHWYIYRRTIADNTRLYSSGTSAYSTNWTNRAALTYA